MTVRLEANYPATDGLAPESVVIEWDGEKPPTAMELSELVGALARVPQQRYPLTRAEGGDRS